MGTLLPAESLSDVPTLICIGPATNKKSNWIYSWVHLSCLRTMHIASAVIH